MKHIDAERLRKELQKPKTELKVGNYYLDNSEQAVGYENALIDFESLLDSLSEEPVNEDLEEAAEISFDEAYALTGDYMDFLAKGLTENQPRPIGPHWFCEYSKK